MFSYRVILLSLALLPSAVMSDPLALATHKDFNEVSLIDTGNLDVIATLPISGGPNGLAVHPNGKYAFVANLNGFDSTCAGNVLIVDVTTAQVVNCVGAGRQKELADVVVAPEGKRVFVLRSDSRDIFHITFDADDPASARAAEVIPLAAGMGSPRRMLAHPDGTRLYVSIAGVNHVEEVTLCEPGCSTVTATYDVGPLPAGMAISPDGATLYVATVIGNKVIAIDTETGGRRPLNVFPGNAGPAAVAASPVGNEIYVANYLNDTVTIIDVSDLTNPTAAVVPVNGRPVDIALHPSADRLVVAHQADGKLSFIDLTTREVTTKPLGKFQDRVGFTSFVTTDEVISDPTQDLIDPEVDTRNNRIVWQELDASNSGMWIADIDPGTGAVEPIDGRGILLDDNLASILETLNGPEWAFGESSTYVVYTDTNTRGKHHIAIAYEQAPDDWVVDRLINGQERFSPTGSRIAGATNAYVSYVAPAPVGNSIVYRDLDNAANTEITVGATSSASFWAEGFPGFVYSRLSPFGLQVALFDVTSGVSELITDDEGNKYLPSVWWAPEYGEYRMMSVVGTQTVGIYRDGGGGYWEQVHEVILPSIHRFVHSPEPFVHNGRSYVSLVAAERLGDGGGGFGTPTGDTEIWIAGLDPDDPFFRRVSEPTRFANRKDPEAYSTSSGVVVLYNEKDPVTGVWLLRRAQTGL